MSADTKTNFFKLLKAQTVYTDSIIELIKQQDEFLKVVREYANKALVSELLKVYNILGTEVSSRAEFGEIYRDINELELHITPSRTSTPILVTTETELLIDLPLYEPLHLKTA